MSLIRTRTPQFPGSIYVQSLSDVDVNSSLPPLRKLFDGGGNKDEEEMLVTAVEIRAAEMKQLPEFQTHKVRAKTFIDDSNVVPLIRWLKHNSLSYPQIEKLIYMSRGNLYAIRHVDEWVKSIYVKGRFMGWH
ncbi:hypothetical protein RHMOL_Rhmol05G0093400 [Rhododendron molle]|uniref:Uncharacterized protein n=1 Tax=Rhododendron molle TaxID=49168 RepID=A0ACC0NN42_RHOML|nr:hypothetical protein RHMOL_Rhmol05G0093400 [Rhododendron molle]